MPKLREISLLIWYLFIIEHSLFAIQFFVRVFADHGWDWLEVGNVVTGAIGVFTLRMLYMFVPITFIYVIVLRNIRLQRLIILALLNVIANVIIILLFDLIETSGARYTLGFAFFSPFILSILPVFNESIKVATGIELVKIL